MASTARYIICFTVVLSTFWIIYSRQMYSVKDWHQLSGQENNLSPVDYDNERIQKAPKMDSDGDMGYCKEKVKHYVMVKIEKTGSTTLFNVLGRFSLRNKLNMLSHREKTYHISWRGPNDGRGQSWILGPNSTERADVLICHAKYNQSIFKKYIQPDYRLIVPLREPVSWIKSAVKYFRKVINYTSPDEFLEDDKLVFLARGKHRVIFHLPQLQWLGFDYSKRNNMAEIKTYIADIIPRIDNIFLNDQFDASLLILKKRFCWDYMDIFYQSAVITNSSKSEISKKSIEKLLSPKVNLGDKLLYDAGNKKWWSQPEVEQQSFWEEVKYFSELNINISTIICRQVTKSESYTIDPSPYHSQLQITESFCSQLRTGSWKIIACTINSIYGKPCGLYN